MRAHADKEANRRLWLGEERIAHRLVQECTTTVAEMVVDGASLIVGYIVGEPDAEVPCIHYVLTRRKCMRLGVCRDLLQPYLENDRVAYSRRPSIRNLPIPEHWQYDPYRAYAHLK